MAKSKEEYKLGMLWQDETKDKEIEDVLKDALSYFAEKFYSLPETIYVNPEITLKQYGNIPLKKDPQMYSKGIMLLIIIQNQ
jgi:hypothetical protein